MGRRSYSRYSRLRYEWQPDAQRETAWSLIRRGGLSPAADPERDRAFYFCASITRVNAGCARFLTLIQWFCRLPR